MHAHPPLIRVLLVDDQEPIHHSVAALLRSVEDLSLVGQAYNGEDALTLCERIHPDLVLMDVVMPRMSGAETTRAILNQSPEIKIVALTSAHEHEYVKSMMDSGAVGYLIKHALADSLPDTIRAVYRGMSVFSTEAVSVIRSSRSSDSFDLTDRELEVLRYVAQGLCDHEVADQLCISHFTVRYHIKNILTKMNVTSRAQALVLAAKNRLI